MVKSSKINIRTSSNLIILLCTYASLVNIFISLLLCQIWIFCFASEPIYILICWNLYVGCYLCLTLHIQPYSEGLFFLVSCKLQLKAFSVYDWVSCSDTWCFMIGFCVFLGYSLISRQSNKQRIISRSSCETKYKELASTVLIVVDHLPFQWP